MDTTWIDRLARQIAAYSTTRRGLARLGVAGALAGLALPAEDVGAACRKPKKPCSKGKQCCSGKCKKGKCSPCATGLTYCKGSGCIDSQTSLDHCGTCGNACVTGQTCDAGVCICDVTTCPNGCCDGAICHTNDAAACGVGGGACTACPVHQACASGSCVDRTCPGGFCRVFVTSTLQTGNLGGLSGADAICQTRAQAAGLPGVYMAWLSNAVSSPATRFLVKSPDPYKRVDGTQIAANWAALTDGGLDAAITITETGAVGTSLYVWTATTTDGNILFGGDCIGWTDGTNGATANNGLRAQSTGQWTQSGFGTSCNSEWSLYCFQQA